MRGKPETLDALHLVLKEHGSNADTRSGGGADSCSGCDPSLERPGDYSGLFDELDELWNRGVILATRYENRNLYRRRGATVLVQNDELEKGIPQAHGRAVVDALRVSAQESRRVQIISGYRTDSENHMKHGAIDVFIEGYSTEQTAKALCGSGARR